MTEKTGRPQSTGSQRVGYNQNDPTCTDARLFFFACGSSAPVRVEYDGGTHAWSWGASVQGHGLPQLHELWPYQSFFELLVAGDQKASLASLSL